MAIIKPLQSITLKNDDGEDTTYVVASAPAIVETTEPASVASFSDGAEGIPVKSLIADINPVQTGSGDPSPSNVRPITGRTGMNVVRTGKNLINFPDCESTNTSAINAQYNAPYWDKLNYHYTFKENTQYTFSCQFSTTDTANSWGLRVEYTNGTVAYIWLHNQTTDTNSITTTANRTVKRILFAYSAAFNLAFSNAQLEEGTTATTFERSGTTYPISWADEAGTVYGGTLDVTTGLLTVTQEILTINDVSWNYYSPSSGNPYFYHTEPTKASVPVRSSENPLICSILPYGGSNYASQFTDGKIWQAANTNIYIVDTSVTTVSAMKTKYGTGTVVYPLATPQTYQLTPQAVLTILGQNNIWADTGDVEVAYCADTKMYIDKVIAAL